MITTKAYVIGTITTYVIVRTRAYASVYTSSLFCGCPEIKRMLIIGQYNGWWILEICGDLFGNCIVMRIGNYRHVQSTQAIANIMIDILLLLAYSLKNASVFGSSFFKSFDVLQLQFYFIDMAGKLGGQYPEMRNHDFYLFHMKDCFSSKRKLSILQANCIYHN